MKNRYSPDPVIRTGDTLAWLLALCTLGIIAVEGLALAKWYWH